VDGSNQNRDGIQPADAFVSAEKFVAFSAWLRAQNAPGADTLPLWWSEWYASSDAQTTQAHQSSVMANSLIRNIQTGATTSLLWGPEGDAKGDAIPLALFSDTRIEGGGAATPFYEVQRTIHENFEAGTQLYDLPGIPRGVAALASAHKALLLNQTPAPISFPLGALDIRLLPYEAKTVDIR
jgi:hypothetical protein